MLGHGVLSDACTRYSHAAVARNGTVYAFGGFSGILHDDVIAFRPVGAPSLVPVELDVRGFKFGFVEV
jgi:hypothetical protein